VGEACSTPERGETYFKILIQNRRETDRLGDLEMGGISNCFYAVKLYQVIDLNCSNNTLCVMIVKCSYKTELYASGLYNAMF
jgi:hypothetical protein